MREYNREERVVEEDNWRYLKMRNVISFVQDVVLCGISQEMRNSKKRRGLQRRNEEYKKIKYINRGEIRSTKKRKITKK